MQSGVTEGKGSRGWKGGLVMTRNLFIALSFSLFLSVEVETFRYRVAQRPTLSSDIPRSSHLPKRKRRMRKRMRRERSSGTFYGGHGCGLQPYIPITIASNGLKCSHSCTWDELPATSSQKTFSTTKLMSPTKRVQKIGEKNEEVN